MTSGMALFIPGAERIKALWDERPHRISHLTALALAPAPVKTGFLDVSGPPVSPTAAKRYEVRAYAESEDTLLDAARHRSGSTWISTPARALLECLKAEDDVSGGHHAAARVLQRADAVDPSAARATADRFGWHEPLRRLASIAARMADCRGVFGSENIGLLPDRQRLLLAVPSASADHEWICILPYTHPCAIEDGEFQDSKYRVVWCWEHPHVLLDQLFR